ncbi:helix-turn-helix domain-containing protein [Thioclava kandeliae]|uniref:Helix-turn-helix transcriptional regulator n=1 Tax=Thioclava kandeliae TaxID=3070818 RepID=A0ABV1SFC7_9RHOB
MTDIEIMESRASSRGEQRGSGLGPHLSGFLGLDPAHAEQADWKLDLSIARKQLAGQEPRRGEFSASNGVGHRRNTDPKRGGHFLASNTVGEVMSGLHENRITPMVYICNSTNGSLPNNPPLVDYVLMKTEHEPKTKAKPARKEFPEIGERLRAVREAMSNLNQKDWASKNGFSISQYSNWENGLRRISVDEAQRLCDLYGLTLDFIYRGRRDGLPESLRNSL